MPIDPNSSPSYTNDGVEAIASACAEMDGTFPENITFKVVGWQHGDSTQRPEQIQAKAYGLSQYLTGADHIALEVALSNLPPDEIEKEFAMFNDFLALNGPFDHTLVSTVGYQRMGIAEGLLHIVKQQHQPSAFRPPRFFPIDSYADPEMQAAYHAIVNNPDLTNRGTLLEQHQIQREILDINQLYGRAVEIAKDGKQHEIVVVTGLLHSRLAKALGRLGALVADTEIAGESIAPDKLGFPPIPAFSTSTGSMFSEVAKLANQRDSASHRFGQHRPPSLLPGNNKSPEPGTSPQPEDSDDERQ
jgi:hypothetical protein